ncbi:MAG: glutaredoxin family protein [Candidatus Bipolaricaulota bacterium]
MEREVIVYSTPVCPWCQVVKKHLDERSVDYREVDVSSDQQAAMEMVRKTGQQAVPVVEIDGEFVVGFDQGRIDQLLAARET